MLSKRTIYLLICLFSKTILADVAVEWSIWDTHSNRQYDSGKITLKSKTVTRLSHLENCFGFFISVYKDDETAARLESKQTGEIRPVRPFKKLIHGIESHCPGQVYSLSVKSTPKKKERKLFD